MKTAMLLSALTLLFLGPTLSACEYCGAYCLHDLYAAQAYSLQGMNYGGWQTPGYGSYAPGYDTYSTWSSGTLYGDGSSSFYQNFGGTDSTYGWVGDGGDMIIMAGGETWWPGK